MKKSESASKNPKAGLIYFIVSVAMLAFFYGNIVQIKQIFPYKIIKSAEEGWFMMKVVLDGHKAAANDTVQVENGRYYFRSDYKRKIPTDKLPEVEDPLTLLSLIKKDSELAVQVVDRKGTVLHEWTPNWFEIWPDATHVPQDKTPRSKPGTLIHGMKLLDNGNLIFNFSYLGLVCLDPKGDVLWKVPKFTHHSIHQGEDGVLWIGGVIDHRTAVDSRPYHDAVHLEPMILRVSTDGTVLSEVSVFDILKKNHREGLMLMSSTNNMTPRVGGDTMHMNDIEPFPDSMEEGFFKHGDVLVSLRNINSVIILNGRDWTVRAIMAGETARQHDPDFIDGNRISVFNNNNVSPTGPGSFSEIVIKDFSKNSLEVYYAGTPEHPFYSAAFGKHQWLANGGLLVAEPLRGRVFELNSEKQIVWEYVNIVDEGYIGVVVDAMRLPENLNREFFRKLR